MRNEQARVITDRTSARDVTDDDIRDLIVRKVHEDSALEFKEAVEPKDLLKAACAIANFGGGFIIIGIHEENGRADSLVNVANSDRVAESARQTIRDGISPRPVFEVAPLAVDGSDVIVVRIAPQNPPHMVSKDKHTDFYMRYEATSDRMRYEEIEQRFRDKHSVDVGALTETPTAVMESTLGRINVGVGAKGAMEATLERVEATDTATFALISTNDQFDGVINHDDAVNILREPLYYRPGGWTVAKPDQAVEYRNGHWEQRNGFTSLTTINASGDATFFKPVDEILCWKQPKLEFLLTPRLYPNAVIEYCLSFAYLLADVIATVLPRQVLVVPAIYAGSEKLSLPLGEGETIWSNVQGQNAKLFEGTKQIGNPIAMSPGVGEAVLARELALKIASQVYSFFGYQPGQLPFVYHDQITLEADAESATLTSIRAYLRDTLMMSVSEPKPHFDRSTSMFAISRPEGRYVLHVSEEFIYTHHWEERRLYELLTSWQLPDKIKSVSSSEKLLLSTKGVIPLPPER